MVEVFLALLLVLLNLYLICKLFSFKVILSMLSLILVSAMHLITGLSAVLLVLIIIYWWFMR